MTDHSNLSWSSYETVKSEAEYNLQHKLAQDIQYIIDRSMERGLNNHFISGLELARGVVLGLTKTPTSEESLNSDRLF